MQHPRDNDLRHYYETVFRIYYEVNLRRLRKHSDSASLGTTYPSWIDRHGPGVAEALRLSSADVDVSVREYVRGDYHVCRGLWAELTNHHRQLYGDSSIGGDDPGSGFDEYLEMPQRVNSWVAVIDGAVIGLIGLVDHGAGGEVEPIVVTNARRRQGVGQTLIEWVAAEASRRGYEYLAIRPVARNVTAIQGFYDAGFRTLGGHIDLTMDLRGRRHRWMETVKLHGLDFRY